jgi:hypothetical protein
MIKKRKKLKISSGGGGGGKGDDNFNTVGLYEVSQVPYLI